MPQRQRQVQAMSHLGETPNTRLFQERNEHIQARNAGLHLYAAYGERTSGPVLRDEWSRGESNPRAGSAAMAPLRV